MNEMEFASMYFGEFKVKGNEIVPIYCPFCGGGQHRDKETFALNKQNHTYNCKRGSCGRQGHFSELCKEFGERMDVDMVDNVMRGMQRKHKKEYKASTVKLTEPSGKVTEYLRKRHISDKTAKEFGISSDEDGNMVFPFYRTMQDFTEKKPTFNKFRKPEKYTKGSGMKMWREKDTQPILFGMHLCTPDKPLVIFEGEFDSMAGHESGIPNCTSIPSGTNDFEWLDTCHDFLENYHTIILFGDNDAAGQKFIDTVSKKLSHHDVMICGCDMYGGAKDCNEILYRYGKEKVLEVFGSAERIPLYGVKDLADIVPMDLRKVHKTTTGFKSFDSKFGGMLDGDMTVLTGEPGAGKSTLISQILNNNIDCGERVCVYSGELTDEQYALWAMLQAAGEDYISYAEDNVGGLTQTIRSDVINAVHEWWRGRYFLYDLGIEDADRWDVILKVFENVYKRYDARTFVVDNLITLDVKDLNPDKYEGQEIFIKKFSAFCKRLKVHGYVVVHPTKEGAEKITKMSQLSGSATISRAANNILAINKAAEGEGYDTELITLKARMTGAMTGVKLKFNATSKQFAEVNGEFPKYGWRKNFKPVGHIPKINEIVKYPGEGDDFGIIAPADTELPF